FGVDIVSSNIRNLVGQEGSSLRTTDGGENWTQQTADTTYWLYAVQFTDENHGTAVGFLEGKIVNTSDGGQNWSLHSSGATGFFGVYFTGNNTGTVVGNDGAILRTTDGGQSWTPQTSGTINQLRAVRFADTNTGTVV